MQRAPSAASVRLLLILLGVLGLALADADDAAPAGPRLGSGAHLYQWQESWPRLPEGARLGPTHGAVAIDREGRVYVNTDGKFAILVFDREGELLRTLGEDLAPGLHGMVIHEREGREELLLAHTRLAEVLAMTLEGELLWRLGAPAELYAEDRVFRPTGVAMAPDGRLFVADGYGESRVHLYDRDRNHLRSIGGFGDAPDEFAIPHGIAVDTRSDPPRLLVADRGNGLVKCFSLEGEPLGALEVELRRPCSIALRGGDLVIAELDGRVTVLDENDELVTRLGDNPDSAQRGQFKVPVDDWRPGTFLSPHYATWDDSGNLYVVDWNRFGRVTKLSRVR